MVLVWRIGEFCSNSPNLKSPNIAPLYYAYAIGYRSSPNQKLANTFRRRIRQNLTLAKFFRYMVYFMSKAAKARARCQWTCSHSSLHGVGRESMGHKMYSTCAKPSSTDPT